MLPIDHIMLSNSLTVQLVPPVNCPFIAIVANITNNKSLQAYPHFFYSITLSTKIVEPNTTYLFE